MPHSLRAKLKNLQRKGELTDKDIAIERLNTIGEYYSQDHSDPYEECERLTKDELDALNMAIKALEQEPCGDAISRDAVWDVMQELWGTSGELIDRLMALPSVNPQESKTGHWVEVTNGRGGHKCNLCNDYAPSYQCGAEYLAKYCPSCGAKMIEPQESEG